MTYEEKKDWEGLADWLNQWGQDSNGMWCPPPPDENRFQPEDRAAILAADAELRALKDRLEKAEGFATNAIAETRKWYSVDIFFPPDEDIVKAIHRQYPGTVDKWSADMARRTCDLVLDNYRAALKSAEEGESEWD